MAKKQGSKEFKFSDLSDILSSATAGTSIIIGDDSNDVNISTGIYILNALFGRSILTGGIPSNRITAIAGETSTGKSYLCYNIAREAQKMGYLIYYIDTEQSIDHEEISKFGIDVSPNKFQLIRSNVIEDLRVMLARLLDSLKEKKDAGFELPKLMIFLDSVGQMASRKEKEDALDGKEKADMTRAKSLASMFRIINSDLGYLNIPLVCTNHTYKTMDMFPRDVMKGGTGLQYSASTIVFLSKAQLKNGDEDELDLNSGITVTAKSVKNRKAKPKKIKFDIDFTEGSNPYKGLEFFCTPENLDTVGIAKGKMEIDKATGKMSFKPGGNKWYVDHLKKSVFESGLFNADVFTPAVLAAIDDLAIDYFSYKSYDEMQESLRAASMEDDSDMVIDLSDQEMGL